MHPDTLALPIIRFPHRIVMVFLFAGAVAAGWALLPGYAERVAMLEQDGHSREALSILEARFLAGDRSYRTLFNLEGLYNQEGRIADARTVLQEMLHARPWDASVRARLVKFYQGVHDDQGEISALGQLIETKYSEDACRELVKLLRIKGNFEREKEALLRCRQKGYRGADDLARLADLLAVEGKTFDAAGILSAIDDVDRLTEPRERFRLAALLLHLGQLKEAERRALTWLRAEGSEEFAVDLVELVAKSHPDVALTIARQAGTRGDAVSLTIADRLVDMGQMKAAALYLKGWIDGADLSEASTIEHFVTSAVAAQDAELAFSVANTFGLQRLPTSVLNGLTDGSLEAGRFAAVAELQRIISTRRGENTDRIARAAAIPPPSAANAVEGSAAPGGSENGRRSQSIAASPGALDLWQRNLFKTAVEQAQKVRVAAVYGPPRPAPVAFLPYRPLPPHFHFIRRQVKPAVKLLKKTTTLIQRSAANKVLRSKEFLQSKQDPQVKQVSQAKQAPQSKQPSQGKQASQSKQAQRAKQILASTQFLPGKPNPQKSTKPIAKTFAVARPSAVARVQIAKASTGKQIKKR